MAGTGRLRRNTCMYDREESDSPIVPRKLLNKSGDNKPLAEAVEGRGELMENT